MRVLLVEDCEVSIELLTNSLRDLEFEDVAVAHDGESALEMFKNEQFDIVVSDWEMPNRNGLFLLKEIRRLDEAIPVIIVTAHSNNENFLAAWSSGGTGFIGKPFAPAEFREAIIRCMPVV